MKYAVEVARRGSLNKAAETLLIAQPNLSRSIKELESDIGITIFKRTSKGMIPTVEGTEFIEYAKGILKQIDQVENLYKNGSPHRRTFSISVPRACYISEAFAQFTKTLDKKPIELFYKETNSQRTILNLTNHDYKLGIIRYAENYEANFKMMLEEKGLQHEVIAEFSYMLIVSNEHPLAKKENVTFDDLQPYIEIAHADPYVPSLPLSKVVKEELPDNIHRRIFIFERASQFDLLSQNKETFMWVSSVPKETLNRYGLTQIQCVDNKKIYKDVLIYHKGYKLSSLDKNFIAALRRVKQEQL